MPPGTEKLHRLCAKYFFSSLQIHLSYDLQPEELVSFIVISSRECTYFFFFFENISGPYILSILCEISNETTILTHANIFQWKSLSKKKASRNSIHFLMRSNNCLSNSRYSISCQD